MTYDDVEDLRDGIPSQQERNDNTCKNCGEFVGWKNLKDGECKLCRETEAGIYPEYQSDQR